MEDWIQIADGYWQKVVETQIGTIVALVHKTQQPDIYAATATLFKAIDPRRTGAGVFSQRQLPLAEAKAECEELISTLTNTPPPIATIEVTPLT